MIRRIVAHLPIGAALFLSLSSLGCGGGGFGDPPSEPPADEYGACARFHEIVGPATWVNPDDTMSAGCASPPDKHVCVSGMVIVAIDRFDETGEGQIGNYYVQDAGDDPPEYGGMTVFRPTFTPPDLRLFEGDVVDLNGLFTEFLGPTAGKFGQCRTLPEVSGTMGFRFDGSRAVEPKVISVLDLKSYETARQHLGMLVKIENVTLTDDGANSSGRYTAPLDVGGGISAADVPKISNELYDIEAEGPALTQGGTFSSITGIVTYFYGFKIAPRSAADFQP